ncbi:hypothetical protein F5Y06DRAFT_99765 [Hypoxylon sp. FL0890]|nr:hypothetical protein F5Y06DRAFT_99765 [Hypoxylon sp. FL0890]
MVKSVAPTLRGMYEPAPPRSKKTHIIRTRTGCRNCRARRKKCDERRPACSACIRLGRRCDGYDTKLKFRNVSFATETHCILSAETESNDGLVSEHFTASEAASQAIGPMHYLFSSRVPFDVALKVDTTMKPSKESFYMSIWGNQCAPALHPIFRRLARIRGLSAVVLDAMMSLAARQLSRMLPRARKSGSLDILGSSFRPDLSQQSVSEEFSGSAMRSVAQWTRADFEHHSTSALAVLILFCYLESLMSNFQGFYLHSAAVETLINIQGDYTAVLSKHRAGLLAAWVQSKMHNWWRRFHFSTPSFQRDHPPLTIEPIIRFMANDSRVSVLSILCESYRLNAAILVYHCNDPVDTAYTSGRDVRVPLNLFQPPLDLSTFLISQEEQLKCQRNALSNWYAHLPPSELPIDLYSTAPSSVQGETSYFKVQPLRFGSHDAAMNFAYYVVASVMQSTEFLSFLQPSHRETQTQMSEACKTVESWIMTLLRIAAGVDWESCTKLNAYTIGISGLLLDCVLRSNDLEVGLWVEDWLSQWYKEGSLEEGSFPIFQILQVLRIINEERRFGRHVYAVCQPIDDGGGVGKFDSYNSQRLISVFVYGWCVDSSCLYSRHITLE